MVGGHHADAVALAQPAPDARDWLGRPQQPLPRELPESHDHPWLDGSDLALQEGLAAQDLVRLGVAVARRPALDHVRDVDLLAPHADGLDDPREELAGTADERQALLVLVSAGRLAHEHERRARVALAEDDVLPPVRKLAARAVAD